MFNLVAVIFAVVNGVPADKPSNVMTYNQTFETLEACMAFPKTDEGLILRNELKELVQSQGGAIAAKLGCTEAEDNSI